MDLATQGNKMIDVASRFAPRKPRGARALAAPIALAAALVAAQGCGTTPETLTVITVRCGEANGPVVWGGTMTSNANGSDEFVWDDAGCSLATALQPGGFDRLRRGWKTALRDQPCPSAIHADS